jgi:Fe-S-cluster-containing dehydrogenase component
MDGWNLIVDVALCSNCGNCQLAAKDEYVGNNFPGYSEPHPAQGAGIFRVERKVRGSGASVDVAYLPRTCNHCDMAPCIQVAPDAVKKRIDGIVMIDSDKARGRRDIVDSCPYGAIIWNEEQQLPQQWIFDAHLLDQGWTMPRCQQVCPTGAIESVKLPAVQMAARVEAEGLAVLLPELGTRPRVYYRNLFRFDCFFIAGSAIALVNGVVECAEGAAVHLLCDGDMVAEASSDAFGDFKFDRLAPGSGAYRLELHHEVFGTAAVSLQLDGDSIALGAIELRRAN